MALLMAWLLTRFLPVRYWMRFLSLGRACPGGGSAVRQDFSRAGALDARSSGRSGNLKRFKASDCSTLSRCDISFALLVYGSQVLWRRARNL